MDSGEGEMEIRHKPYVFTEARVDITTLQLHYTMCIVCKYAYDKGRNTGSYINRVIVSPEKSEPNWGSNPGPSDC